MQNMQFALSAAHYSFVFVTRNEYIVCIKKYGINWEKNRT